MDATRHQTGDGEADSLQGSDGDEESGLGKREQEKRPFSRVGYGASALRRGDIALFATRGEEAIRVGSGEVIGEVGVFGEGIEEDALLHVEFFADESLKEAIDLSLHGAHFIPLTEDISGSLRVTDRNPLKLMRQKSSGRARKKGIPVSQTRSGSE